MFFDPLYMVIMLAGMALGGLAQWKVRSAYSKYSNIPTSRGISGAEVAQMILQANDLDHVNIEQARGFLGDHYDPRNKVLRLSPDVYHGRTIAAAGIAAHEVGHAIQDKVRYGPLVARNAIVPMASLGSNMAFILLMAGVFLRIAGLMYAACAVFAVVVVFQLINLPVEFDASNRARKVLAGHNIVTEEEGRGVAKVLNAAALTYVAATVTAVLQLLYFLLRSGLIGGRR